MRERSVVVAKELETMTISDILPERV